MIVNIILYCRIEILSIKQKKVNEILKVEVVNLEAQTRLAQDFQRKLNIIEDKIIQVRKLANNKTSIVNVMQYLDRAVPSQIYFTNLDVFLNKSTINFKGNALSPLYIAQFMDTLGESGSIFNTPILRANNSLNDETYYFEITADFNKVMAKLEYESAY